MAFLWSQLFVIPAYPEKSFAGQTIIVTGSNTGLGKAAARHYVRLGAAKVILAVRNTKAGEEAKLEITDKSNIDVVEVWHLDQSSYESVKSFAARASKELPRIDVLLLNAGVATWTFQLAEGHERSITINVISTFLLAFLLLPKLRATAKDFNTQPRLTVVSSEVHGFIKFPEWREPKIFEALSDKDKANMGDRYPATKLLQVLAVREMAAKMPDSGPILNYLHPGLCHSELARETSWVHTIFKFFFARSTEHGSRTLVLATEFGPESHGRYMTDGKINDGALSRFVKSDDGKKAGEKVWKELKEILENIEPGVTKIL